MGTLQVIPGASLIDSIDSHYWYVRTRLLQAVTKNPVGDSVTGAFPAAGYVLAQDWPPKDVKPNEFYLLTMGDDPIGRQGYSASSPMQFHHVVWKAIVVGDELTQGERAANRGTRFRTLWALKEAFRQAMYPFFAEKLTFSIVNGRFVGVSKTPVQYITWTPPSVKETLQTDSGDVEFSAMLRIWDATDEILA